MKNAKCIMGGSRFIFHYSLFIIFLAGCQSRQSADLLVTNATVYTADSSFSTATAFVVKDGKFVAVGKADDLAKQFDADSTADLGGKPVFPGFFDPHSHFLGLGQMLDQADLVGAASYAELVQRLKTFQQKNPEAMWLVGRGWDQNDWPKSDSPVRGFPTKAMLDAAFPNIPVALTRVFTNSA